MHQPRKKFWCTHQKNIENSGLVDAIIWQFKIRKMWKWNIIMTLAAKLVIGFIVHKHYFAYRIQEELLVVYEKKFDSKKKPLYVFCW